MSRYPVKDDGMASRETWDLLIKGGGAAAAIATVAVSATVFLSQRERSIQDFERETKRPFLDEQFKLYGEAVAVTSRLAHAFEKEQQPTGKAFSDDLDRFWVLYWGPLAMVEDSHVEEAMVIFGRSLQDRQNGSSNECARMIQQASLALAHRVRESLEQQWAVQLIVQDEDLQKRDEDLTALLGACQADRPLK
jgi:hypothetical protein